MSSLHISLKLLWVGLIATLVVSFFPTIWNVDIFWHVAAGNWILENGVLPTTDIFSALSPEREWIPFQWLYEVIAALLYNVGEMAGLRLFSGLLLLGSLWLLIHRLKASHSDPWAILALTALAFILFGDRIRVRPHLFNMFFLFLYWPLLMSKPEEVRPGTVLKKLLPGIALWANLHAGGALIFIVVLAALPGGALLDHWLNKRRGTNLSRTPLHNNFMIWLSAVATAALMPNFLTGAYHSLFMLTASEKIITEWKPAWSWLSLFMTHGHPSMLLVGLTPFITLFLSLALPLMGQGKEQTKQWSASQWLLATGISIIAIRYGRFAWMCILPCSLIAQQIPTFRLFSKAPVSVGAAFLLAGLVFNYQILVVKGGITNFLPSLAVHIDERRFPVMASHFLGAANIEGNAWTLPNWGGYLLLKNEGKIKVLSDGRGNYSEEVADELDHIYNHRWKSEALGKTLDIYNRHKEINLIILQAPALPRGAQLRGWTQIFPIHPTWAKTLGLPAQAASPVKEVVYVRNTSFENIEKAGKLWGGQTPLPPPGK